MAVATGQVTITSSPTLIVPIRSRSGVSLVHHGGQDVFVGDSAVTATTGALLTGTKGTPMTWLGSDALYGITASGTATVGFAENT